MATAYQPEVTGDGVRARVQRLGGHLAGMVMPNIGAFIAWGLITALFIPTGWLPNEDMAALGEPMIKFLLPLLIGYTGGRMVHGQRGGVVGAVATVGVIVGAEMPMFLAAMIIGPLTAYLMRLFDGLIEGRVRTGFEMLVDNFSAGILAAAMALVGRVVVGPVMRALTDAAAAAVGWVVDHNLLPAASVLIEPAKVLFLNNAVNHGVLGPLGVQQAAEAGKSILFTLESNPGPGLGVLLAYFFFGPRRLRASTPAAMIIHFLGGIHEIYFPYVLMKPRMILAAIAGGATGVAIFLGFGTGLVATPSPGSVFAYLAQTPRGASNWIGIYTGMIASVVVSFAVGAALLGFGRLADARAAAPTESGADTPAKAPAEPAERVPVSAGDRPRDRSEGGADPVDGIAGKDIRKLVVACDAGMGSSVMLAGQLRKQLEKEPVTVEHTPVDSIPGDADVVVCHGDLAERARRAAPGALVVAFEVYLGDPVVDDVVTAIKDGGVLRV